MLTFSVLLKGNKRTQGVCWETNFHRFLRSAHLVSRGTDGFHSKTNSLGRWSQGLLVGQRADLFAIWDNKIMSPPRPKPLMGLRFLSYVVTLLLCSTAPNLRGLRVRRIHEHEPQAACCTLSFKGLCICSRRVL